MSEELKRTILGVGVDLCDIPRYLQISAKFQGGFEKKLFTSFEMQHWEQYGGNRLENLAVLFAGKEAMIKALGQKLESASYGYHDFLVLFHLDHLQLKLSEALQQQLFGPQPLFWKANFTCTIDYVIVTVILEQ